MNALFSFFGMLGCHQRPDRGFFFPGRPHPLCARCTGIFAGYVIGGILFALGAIPPLWVCAIALLFPLFDWGRQYYFGRESTNVRRLITGIIGGWGLITLAISGVIWAFSLIFG